MSTFDYRKKPVVVQAFQMTKDSDQTTAFPDWLFGAIMQGAISESTDGHFLVQTMEGTMMGKPGDYVIRGIRGEFYPCDKEIFDATYEKV